MRQSTNCNARKNTTQSIIGYSLFLSLLAFVAPPTKAQQINDSSFITSVTRPAYVKTHPRVMIDAAHYNIFSTVTNRIEPFVKLISSDGFQVDMANRTFTSSMLKGTDILIIMTAQGGSESSGDSMRLSAFTELEIETLYQWVNQGGSLLYAIDHSPFNYAGLKLAKRFGVQISIGTIADSVNSEARMPVLIFSRANGLLGDHPITTGRDLQERVNKVGVWGGQSITGPSGSTTLFRLSPTAYNAGDRADLETKNYRPPNVWGNAQAIAFTLGKGQIVMTTDCSMWTAQLINNYGQYGMARKDLDNRQFALNVMHWLSHLLK